MRSLQPCIPGRTRTCISLPSEGSACPLGYEDLFARMQAMTASSMTTPAVIHQIISYAATGTAVSGISSSMRGTLQHVHLLPRTQI